MGETTNYPDRLDSESAEETVQEPEPTYFYTKNYPHRWGNGPIVYDYNAEFGPIESLEEAKELALKAKVGGHNDDHCDTTYGMKYKA